MDPLDIRRVSAIDTSLVDLPARTAGPSWSPIHIGAGAGRDTNLLGPHLIARESLGPLMEYQARILEGIAKCYQLAATSVRAHIRATHTDVSALPSAGEDRAVHPSKTSFQEATDIILSMEAEIVESINDVNMMMGTLRIKHADYFYLKTLRESGSAVINEEVFATLAACYEKEWRSLLAQKRLLLELGLQVTRSGKALCDYCLVQDS